MGEIEWIYSSAETASTKLTEKLALFIEHGNRQDVARYKLAHGLPVYQQDRKTRCWKGRAPWRYGREMRALFANIMDISKARQQQMIGARQSFCPGSLKRHGGRRPN
ncbi:MAG: hypothetical protein ACLSAP_10020 [Oscillospiraceae bacterium]